MVDGKKKIEQYQRYISRDVNFRAGWDALAPYIQPTRTQILTHGLKVPGRDQTLELYDSTSVTVAETAASFVWGNVLNPSTKWVTMSPRDDQLAQLDEVREWGDEVIKILLAAYDQSNFYYEAYEALIDYIGFGTCDLHIEERRPDQNREPQLGFRGFVFKAFPIGTFTIDENAAGEVDLRYVCWPLSARAIVGEFGEDACSDEIKTAARNESQKQFEIIQCIEPRGYGEQKSKAAKHMPYASYWIEKEKGHVLRESGYEEFPDAIARYQKTGGEVYGRSPGFTALPDIRTLNQLRFDSFESLEMAIKPPILSAMEEGSIGTIQLFPGGMNVVKLRPGMNDVRQAMGTFESGTKWDITNIEYEKLVASIERVFNIKSIRDLLEAEKTQTFGEWSGKLALLNKMMGPVWGRMQAEFLNRCNERAFNIMLRRGAFPPPPEVLLEQGADFDWKYQGPLARAQRIGEVEAIMTYANHGTVISQFEADAIIRFDGDEAMKVLADVLGVPGKVVRSDEEVQEIMTAKTAAREKQTQQENMMQMTEAAKNLAPLAQQVVAGQA